MRRRGINDLSRKLEAISIKIGKLKVRHGIIGVRNVFLKMRLDMFLIFCLLVSKERLAADRAHAGIGMVLHVIGDHQIR